MQVVPLRASLKISLDYKKPSVEEPKSFYKAIVKMNIHCLISISQIDNPKLPHISKKK